MNRIINIFKMLMLGVWVFSCSPDEVNLGNIDVASAELVEGIAFKIEHDATNPNIVYLTSLMDSKYAPQWEHPQGRSQESVVTLKIPFPGTYTVKYGIQTRGGIVYGDPVTFTVDDMYAGFIEDPMWSLVAGGSGLEKTWYLDLDADGVSRFFTAPIYFFSNWYEWKNIHSADGGNYIDTEGWNWQNAMVPAYKRGPNADINDRSFPDQVGVQAWYWLPAWKGNEWMAAAADFGTMTFGLKGSADVVVDQEDYGLGFHEGKFLIDVDNKMIKFTDARPLHDSNRDADATVDWYNVRILYLSEDAMQLGIVPAANDGTMVVYNYISKDYKENWVPGEVPDPEPPYNGTPGDDLTTTTTTSKTWTSNLVAPYNWANLSGNFLNTWTVNDEGTPVFTTWAPPYNEDALSNLSLTMTKETATTGTYEVTTTAGTELTGSYTIEPGNWINFGQDITFISLDWLSIQTEGGKMRIIRTETDLSGDISVLHLGRHNASNENEYSTIALVPSGVGGDPEPEPTVVAFDNTKLKFGDLETNGKLRLEMYNDFGATKNDPPLNTADLVVNKRIEVSFTLGGITLKSGAAGSYTTAFSLADGDWDPSHWGGGPGETTVTGNGTYTVWYEPAAASVGAVVFVIDIGGLATDIADMSTVTATINSIKVL